MTYVSKLGKTTQVKSSEEPKLAQLFEKKRVLSSDLEMAALAVEQMENPAVAKQQERVDYHLQMIDVQLSDFEKMNIMEIASLLGQRKALVEIGSLRYIAARKKAIQQKILDVEKEIKDVMEGKNVSIPR